VARPRKKQSQSHDKLTPGQASYVIDRLIGDRRVSWTEVHRYTEDMKREINHLEQRLKSLRDAAGEAVRGAVEALKPGRRRGRPPGSVNKAGGKKRARRSAITAEQLASRQLQGRYLGLIRQIPASRRAQYQRIAKEKGREAAIKEMQSNLHK